MSIARTPMVDDDGSGTTGTIINNAWKTEFYNQIDATVGASVGLWNAVPFNAANFSADSGAWTVGAPAVVDNRYTVIGKTLFWHFYISWFAGSNAVTGAPLQLLLTPPGGVILPSFQQHVCPYALDGNGARVDADVTIQANNKVGIIKRNGAAWLAGPPGLIVNCWLEIN